VRNCLLYLAFAGLVLQYLQLAFECSAAKVVHAVNITAVSNPAAYVNKEHSSNTP
jgi:hypothetical protein